MKIYEIYSLIRTRCQGEKETKEKEFYDGPYFCPESAKEEMEVLNQEKKSTRHIIKEKKEIHTSFQVFKRDPNATEKDQYLQDQWELEQEKREEEEEEKELEKEKATIIKPKKKKTVIEDDEKRTRLTIFPQTKEDEACLEAQIPY